MIVAVLSVSEFQSNRKGTMILSFWKDLCVGVINLFFPPLCPGCNQRINELRSGICPDCWEQVIPLLPLEVKAKQVPEHLDAIFPVFKFNPLIQNLVHALKYQGLKSLGVALGKYAGIQVRPMISTEPDTVLIPIPLHPIKLRERGYNQSDYIADGFAISLQLPVRKDILRRIKNTVTQTQLTAEERHQNMQDAFSVKKNVDLTKVKNVILIDDVLTTGSTMNSAAEVLKKVGIQRIYGLTVATPI
jgi:competence protein ComFC